MAKKMISTCDRCRTNYADFSIHVRDAKTNLALKLTKKDEADKPGPFDLCKECLGKVIGCISTVQPELPVEKK